MTTNVEPAAVELTRRVFAAFSSRDSSQLAEVISPDCKLIAVLPESQPHLHLYGTFIGPDGAKSFLENLTEAYDTQSFDLIDVFGDETRACAYGKFAHTIKPTGRLFESDWSVVIRVENGKMAFYQFYEDTAALEQAFEVVRRNN